MRATIGPAPARFTGFLARAAKGSKSPVRGLVIAGGGNAGAGVEAVVISGAEAAEALLPGTLAGGLKPAKMDAPELETV